MQICIFTCSEYSESKGDTMYSSNMNNIGKMFVPKKWVSVWLYISVASAQQKPCTDFIYFIKYTVVSCIDIKYHPIYVYINTL